MNTVPCSSDPQLFDSTELGDHREAVKLCHACPVLEQCREYLKQQKADHPAQVGGPVGTWAGVLMNQYGRQVVLGASFREAENVRIATEEQQYTHTEAKRAHAAYVAGDRTPWAATGNRVYQRRSAAAKKASAA